MSTTTLDLPANLTISTAEALHEKLEPLLLKDSDIAIVGKDVERVDTAGLQLVLAFKNALVKRNLGFTWKNYSDALFNAALQLGLEKHLALDSAKPKKGS